MFLLVDLIGARQLLNLTEVIFSRDFSCSVSFMPIDKTFCSMLFYCLYYCLASVRGMVLLQVL